ncbi:MULTISPECIES: glycosyltransferase family 4 protein [Kribbella]|jgi:glycosyltransferase involved in cell wall biosynthesis|uniref:Glycosyltransferase involved in cell wall biosynthesis n=1 Tax=Kribbella pratensis TaxID=2512112 RepID=A0ABY2FMT4_9ACTN|nr:MULTISPECIES: glycosyltransferase family 4 protein [Kribbella]TDW94238.1 glycosyltransferase involved in cell wall biosynthesis [Kribbella pratensis]TDX02847.1 glycosyltransferase involved in cell wall biosynthesis [Kribbella sp. VKM Ac-2566]
MTNATAEQSRRPDRLDTEIVMTMLMRRNGGSGVQTHVRTVGQYLDAATRPTSVVNPFSSKDPLLPPVFGARFAIRLFSPQASVWWYRYWHAYYLERALAAHLSGAGPAVVYAQCPVSAAVALRVRTTQPVVMAAHFNLSQADEWAGKGDIDPSGTMFGAIRSFEEQVLTELDGIVYVSEFARSVLEERMPAIRNVPGIVIPNPVNIPLQGAGAAHTADLITVGAVEPRKNHRYLLEVLAAAARRGHRYTLSVVGDGPDRRALQGLAKALGLGDQVRFLGYQADPPSLMAGHRLYCHTATMENLPIALLEAMAGGLPVVAGAVGGIPEIVRPGQEGQFWPLDDAEAAAGVLIEVLEDPARLQAMSAAATVRAETEFSSEVVGKRLVSFLENIEIRRGKLTDQPD